MDFVAYQNSMSAFPYIPHDYAQFPPPSQARVPFLTHRASVPNLSRGRLHGPGKTDSKPRLTKEERDVLEREFQKTYKPSSATKKELAEALKLDRVKVDTWFQNRRAKAKQEKKQEQKAEEARQAQLKQQENQETQTDQADQETDQESSTQQQETESLLQAQTQESSAHSSQETLQQDEVSGPSSTLDAEESSDVHNASFIPHYEDSSSTDLESMESLNRVIASVRQARSAEELNTLHHHASGMQSSFDASLPFGCFSHDSIPTEPFEMPDNMLSLDQNVMSDARHYSIAATDSTPLSDDMLQMTHSMSGSSMASFLMSGNSTPFDGLPHLFEESSTTPTTNLMPPQLLAVANHSTDSLDDTGMNFQSASSDQVIDDAGDAHFSIKSPPPPSNLATRRSKPRPAALAPAALSNHGHTGPRTFSFSESKRSMVGPLSPGRRIMSTTGNFNRIQKSSNMASQRAQLNLQAFTDADLFGQHNHSLKMPMSASLPLQASSLAPPTPLSPRVRLPQQEQERSSSTTPSNSDSRPGLVYDDGFMYLGETEQSLASPPDTPHQFLEQQQSYANSDSVLQWQSSVYYDQPLHTPAADSFGSTIQMPEPHYIAPSSGSQPATPGFGQPNWMFGPQSPQLGLTTALRESYSFPADYNAYFALQSGKSSPTQGKQQTVYTFSVTTPAEYKTTK